MRIETYERVVYRNNPLAEVVCQVRFEPFEELSLDERAALRDQFGAAGYGNHGESVLIGAPQPMVGVWIQGATPDQLPRIVVQNFATVDGVWRVTACSQFIALTCTKYTGWQDFKPRLTAAVESFLSRHPDARPTRLGLRYKDVIEREPLGLEGVGWHELIRPFLLGPLAPGALADGQIASESDVGTFVSQALLKLDDASLLLQSSLLNSADGQRKAFLVDGDFFNEGGLESDLLRNPEALSRRLDALHASAGALFRRGITERLHHALNPDA